MNQQDSWDEEEVEEPVTVLGPHGPQLCKDLCTTCIFRPGNPMNLQPGRVKQMVRDSLAGGSFITCHSTLPQVSGKRIGAICRGFFDRYAHQSNLLRIWGRIGGFHEVEPPSIKKGDH